MGKIIRTTTERGKKSYLWQNSRRTNKAAEAFHSQFKAQFYAAQPNIFVFIDVLNKLQAIHMWNNT